MDSNYNNQLKSILNSPFGEWIIEELNNRKQQLQDDAANEKTADSAFGLLNKAGGVILAIEHLQFLSVAPTEGRDKSNN